MERVEWTGYWVMNLVTRLAMCSHPIWWSPKPLTHWPRTISGMSSWLNHQAPNALGLGSALNSQLDLSYIYGKPMVHGGCNVFVVPYFGATFFRADDMKWGYPAGLPPQVAKSISQLSVTIHIYIHF